MVDKGCHSWRPFFLKNSFCIIKRIFEGDYKKEPASVNHFAGYLLFMGEAMNKISFGELNV
jgi:hypothetical protein